MAGTATPSNEQVHTVSLKVLVGKKNNKVLFAEAKKDFVDVLLSFLTLPLGTIARLVAKESNIKPVKVGSLSTLYESLSHLEEVHFRTKTCKEMLLQPRNSMESYCRQMKLNIDDTEPTQYFICDKWECSRKKNGSRLSIFRNQRCHCGDLLKMVITPENNISKEEGFVKKNATFIVFDDLYITPNVFGASVKNLFKKNGIDDMEDVKEETVLISKKEVRFLSLVLLFLLLPFVIFFILFHFSLVCSYLSVGSGLA